MHNNNLIHIVRCERTVSELRRLKDDITTWLNEEDNRDRDEQGNYLGRHKTRLEALRSILTGAADTLEAEIARVDISPTRDTGEVYKDFRDYDQSVVWLRHVFTFYRNKFEQRVDKTSLGPLLEAADEVIWSCYREVYAQLKWKVDELEQTPPPLAYLSPDYSPAAWNPIKGAPAELYSILPVTGIEEFVKKLPVGLLCLPPWSVESPWWFIFIAHEIGHHIQANLGLIEPYKSLVTAAAQRHQLPKGLVDRWAIWAEEIFADLFSVMMLGPSAAEALVEVEWSTSKDLSQRRREYPQGIVRLCFIDSAVQALNLGSPLAAYQLTDKISTAANPEVLNNLAVANDLLAKSLDDWQPDLGLMRDWCNTPVIFNAFTSSDTAAETVQFWAQSLPQKSSVPRRSLALPRILVCGGFQAWKGLVAQDLSPDARRQALDRLRRNLIETLRRSGPTDTRAGVVCLETVKTKGPELAGLLVSASHRCSEVAINEAGDAGV